MSAVLTPPPSAPVYDSAALRRALFDRQPAILGPDDLLDDGGDAAPVPALQDPPAGWGHLPDVAVREAGRERPEYRPTPRVWATLMSAMTWGSGFLVSLAWHGVVLLLIAALLPMLEPEEERVYQVAVAEDAPVDEFAEEVDPLNMSEGEHDLPTPDPDPVEEVVDTRDDRDDAAKTLPPAEDVPVPARPGPETLAPGGMMDPLGELGGDDGLGLPDGAFGGVRDFKEYITRANRHGLDVVFVFDTTGSMGSALRTVQDRLDAIARRTAEFVPNFRLGAVAYRDRGRSEDYLTIETDLTKHRDETIRWFRRTRASGGGDTPEAVRHGLSAAMDDLRWENAARKVIILVGDAPPHQRDMRHIRRLVGDFTDREGVVSTISVNQGGGAVPGFTSIARWGRGVATSLEGGDVVDRLVALSLGYVDEEGRPADLDDVDEDGNLARDLDKRIGDLREQGGAAACRQLSMLLRHEEAAVRRPAAEALGDLARDGEPAALPPLMVAAPREQDVRVLRMIVRGLAVSGNRAAGRALLPLLEHGAGEIRVAALEALRRLFPDGPEFGIPAEWRAHLEEAGIVR